MKKLFTLLILALLSTQLSAQAPQAINYQGIARDQSGTQLQNQSVGLRLSVRQSSPTGTTVYQETHSTTTNQFGLFTVQIGAGTTVSGVFSSINWGGNSHYLQIEMDPAGGTTYTNLGTSQLITVPYAFFADEANSVVNDQVNDADADSTNELNQTLVLNGQTLELTDAGGTLSANLSSLAGGGSSLDNDTTNELNTSATLTGTTLGITDPGGTINVNLSSLVDDADAVIGNEYITSAALSGNTLNIVDGGGTKSVNLSSLVNDADAVIGNEYNTGASLSGTTLSITDGGGSQTVNLSSLVNDNDSDPFNEIQTLSISNDTVFLSKNGGFAKLPSSGGGSGDSDWTVSGNDQYSAVSGNVGVGVTSPTRKLSVLNSFGMEDVLGNEYLLASSINGSGGILETYGTIGNRNAALTSYSFSPNNGIISVFDSLDGESATMRAYDGIGSAIISYNESGNIGVALGTDAFVGTGTNQQGYLSVNTVGGFEAVELFSDPTDSIGTGFTYGSAGSVNDVLGFYGSTYPDHGYVGVLDASSNAQAGMYVDPSGDGIVFGTTKSFRVDHPEDETKEIWYACIEGPEAAMYVRGTAQLSNGQVFVPFPEHFELLADIPSLTINLTPLSASSEGLAVIEKREDGFVVAELRNGKGNYEFDWEAKAVRKNQKDFKVIRSKDELPFDNAESKARNASRRQQNSRTAPLKR